MPHRSRDFSSSGRTLQSVQQGLTRKRTWEAGGGCTDCRRGCRHRQGSTEGLRDAGGTGGSGGRERQGGEGAGLGEEGGPASTGIEHWDVADLDLQSYQPISWGPRC